MSVIAVGIVNAIFWGGVIIFLLFRLGAGSRKLEARLAELEAMPDDGPGD